VSAKSSFKTKKVHPVFAVVIILVAVLAALAIGFNALKDKPAPGGGPPPMTKEERKQRQKESTIWGEELARADREHRLPNYDLLPRTGHPGAPAATPPPVVKKPADKATK
jgi:hypothetical protein